ncbi:MAG: hypothetical protein ABW278_08475 [Steroidobacteraceae bacterium]
MKHRSWGRTALVLTSCAWFCAVQAAQSVPKGFVEVRPVTRAPQPAAQSLQLATGQFFTYALPQGWHVGEDGQFALTLLAADNKALTVMVGNAGVPINYPPAQYVHERLMAIRPQNLQLGAPRPVQPIAGFAQALQYPVHYSINGVPCQGLATVHIAPAYDTAVMAVTAALSEARQWPGYSTWLPLVAAQVAARNGAAFGARGVMQQNLQNSAAYAQAAKEYRDWSQKNWQGVTDQRNESTARNNAQFRDALGNVQRYDNPRDPRTPVELPNTWQYYWVNEQGTIVGTNEARLDPNAGSTREWRQMPRHP